MYYNQYDPYAGFYNNAIEDVNRQTPYDFNILPIGGGQPGGFPGGFPGGGPGGFPGGFPGGGPGGFPGGFPGGGPGGFPGGFPGGGPGGFPGGFPGGGQPGGFPGGFPGGGPGGFPGGFPGGGQPGGFPGGFPGGGQQGPDGQLAGPPSTPPPSFTPQLSQQDLSLFAVDPGAIRRCLYRFTYIWLESGRSFWFYPIFIGRNSVAGYRWRRGRWVYYGTDLRSIRSFQCGGR